MSDESIKITKVNTKEMEDELRKAILKVLEKEHLDLESIKPTMLVFNHIMNGELTICVWKNGRIICGQPAPDFLNKLRKLGKDNDWGGSEFPEGF